ncbi:hypothetical protein M413DRAFT_442220 [Hebeloma cylindrosporum]|uniref:Uncharacterized protein n=1 Tax=Hebeloma cylindrosporum TaxID=76867 RepID=A0A0C3CP11_HEBCY|nr:hypothetical protein M413DRAFT_442220 [Hebeloma cylindrosporum h7]
MAHRGQTIHYHQARRLINTRNPPWVYGFPLDYDFLTDTYGAKFVPTPPDFGPNPTEMERMDLDRRRASQAMKHISIACRKAWPLLIGVVPGFSKTSGRTGVLALFACTKPNRDYVPTEEELLQLEALKEILFSEGFTFPNELSAWFVAV